MPFKNTTGAFQTDLFSGSFGYQYKIDVPPGTNGLTPDLSISYNSHSAKGKAGWVGAGWEIPLSYIQRNIQYTRKTTSDDTFDLYLGGAKHDLVKTGAGIYHTKVEAYLKIEHKDDPTPPNDGGTYWVVTTKDGTEYRFGYSTVSENMVNTSDPSMTPYVWRWSLDRIKDSNGNCIYFTYVEDQGSVYLDTITYNNVGKRVIQFVRESKPDAFLIIDQGSEVYDAYRLSEIQVKVNGSLARKYKLSYALNETQNKSLLTFITQYGADGTSSLPPVKFQYTSLNNGFSEGAEWSTPGTKDIRTVDKDKNDTDGDTFDVNGDGLPDIVRFDETQAVHNNWDVWLNTGAGFSGNQLTWSVPKGWSIRNNDVSTGRRVTIPFI
ncbi:MAG: SpvB/TcaC N-terminal domain-containing protein [Nitrospirota bacterium]|nr:SpvB/TcaC N-terminal domain-containing protein [Nitrospirota bacterium]